MIPGSLALSFSRSRPGVGFHRGLLCLTLTACPALSAQDRPNPPPAPAPERNRPERNRPERNQPESPEAEPAPKTEVRRPAPRRPRRIIRELDYDDASIDPDRAALYGIFPGGGQWYLGQEGTAFVQLGLFLGAEYLFRQGQTGDDYIPANERRVTFSPEHFLVARELNKHGLLYRDRQIPPGMNGTLLLYAAHRRGLANPLVPNLIGESKTERAARMAGDGNLIEINPLVSNGGQYYRTNRSTIETDTFGDLAQWTLFYSIFSADRDARAYRDGLDPEDDFVALSSAPFRPEIVKDPFIWFPVLAAPLLLEYERRGGREVDPLTARPYNLLVPASTLNDPSVQSTMLARSLGNALAEEALFRGVAHRRLSGAYGFAAGSVLSSSLYAAYQYGRGNHNFWPQFAYSMYWSYLDLRGDSDLRPTVASHFWTNVAILLFSLSSARADERAGKSSQEIHFMPVFFTFDA